MRSANKFLLVFSLIFVFSSIAHGEPIINGVSGNFLHGQTVVLSGSGFGMKSPAAPLVWDDGTTAGDLARFYSEALPSNAQQGNEYNMQYRQLPFRNIGGPHGRISFVLGGAHATNTNSGQYLSGNNVSLLVPMASFNFFAQYWYRVDPNFEEEIHPTMADNMKELCLSGSNTQIYGGTWGYYNWCNNLVPNVNQTGPVRIARAGADCPQLPYACSADEYAVSHNNPINGWIKMQWEGDYNSTFDNPTVRLTTYPDGRVTDTDHYGNDITTTETLFGCGTPPAGGMRGLGIGGFSRVPRANNGVNSFRYFAGIYVDDTHSRVMLGDNADYGLSTMMEPMIPVSWNDNSIDVSVNLAGFAGGMTAYLFVFDASNNRNVIGFPVVIGGSSNPDTMPPSPPLNPRVN